MQTFPSVVQNFFDKSGKIADAFLKYFTQFTIPPPPFLDVTPDGSPFEYVALEPGNLFVTGGTVSAITLTRGSDTITLFPNTTTPRLVPVAVSDSVTITYTVIPTVKFIPSYGYNTTSQ